MSLSDENPATFGGFTGYVGLVGGAPKDFIPLSTESRRREGFFVTKTRWTGFESAGNWRFKLAAESGNSVSVDLLKIQISMRAT